MLMLPLLMHLAVTHVLLTEEDCMHSTLACVPFPLWRLYSRCTSIGALLQAYQPLMDISNRLMTAPAAMHAGMPWSWKRFVWACGVPWPPSWQLPRLRMMRCMALHLGSLP